MELNVPDTTLVDRLRADHELAGQYRRLALYFLQHTAKVSTSMTDPLSDAGKQLFDSFLRYLPYVLSVEPDFLSTVTSTNFPNAAALKLQAELPGIGFDQNAYVAERNARIKALEKPKR